jgi:hypothetical protein
VHYSKENKGRIRQNTHFYADNKPKKLEIPTILSSLHYELVTYLQTFIHSGSSPLASTPSLLTLLLLDWHITVFDRCCGLDMKFSPKGSCVEDLVPKVMFRVGHLGNDWIMKTLPSSMGYSTDGSVS